MLASLSINSGSPHSSLPSTAGAEYFSQASHPSPQELGASAYSEPYLFRALTWAAMCCALAMSARTRYTTFRSDTLPRGCAERCSSLRTEKTA